MNREGHALKSVETATKDMTEQNYEYLEPGIKAWTKGVPVEDEAMAQLRNVAGLPFIHKHVAVMPDCHWGAGTTIGSVIPTKGAIIPAAVGVDIGCGMAAVQTTLTSHDLPDNLSGIRTAIEKAVPHGCTDHGGQSDRGAWGDVPDRTGTILAREPGGPLQGHYREAPQGSKQQQCPPSRDVGHRQPFH